MEYSEYLTRVGDRPDLIAYLHYGSFYLYAGIIKANPSIMSLPILPSGLTLKIPTLPDTAVITDPDLLPPWKR